MIISPDTSPSKTVDLTKLKMQATEIDISTTPIMINSVKLRYELVAGATAQWSFRQKKYDFFRHANNYAVK